MNSRATTSYPTLSGDKLLIVLKHKYMPISITYLQTSPNVNMKSFSNRGLAYNLMMMFTNIYWTYLMFEKLVTRQHWTREAVSWEFINS